MKICKICGGEVPHGRRSYCSDDCYIIANRNRARSQSNRVSNVPLPPIKCLNCGKEFIRKQEKQKYCNWKCQKEMLKSEKKLKYKINSLAKIMNFDLKNVDKILRAKKLLFNAENLHRCPCDAQNPERFCGSIQCMNDIINNGHCECRLFWLKKD